MTNVNLFGGPGTGKSTTAAQIFAKLKATGIKVELLQEYAKDLTYGKDSVKLSDQVHVLGEQYHRMFRLKDSVDFLMHDSPFIMGATYIQESTFPKKEFVDFVIKLFNTHNNLNIFLNRNNDLHPYQEYGRSQTLKEAIAKDDEIKLFLINNNVPFIDVTIDDSTTATILSYMHV